MIVFVRPDVSQEALAFIEQNLKSQPNVIDIDKLVFLDIYVDPSEHVYPMQIAKGSMRDMLLSKTERT
mgnify:CR=1 FL=1